MSSQIRRLATLVAAAMVLTSVATVGLVGPAVAQDDAEQTDEEPSVRLVHASPDAGPVDVYVDGERTAENVSFSTFVTLPVDAGPHNVSLTEAGNESNVVSSVNATFEAGTGYAVAASGEVSADADTAFELTVYTINETEVADDEAAVQLIHLSPDAGPVDVTANDTVVFDNVSFRNATEFVTVPAGNYTVDVRAATETNDGEVVETVNVSLDGGTATTAFALGNVEPEEGAEDTAFRVLFLTDVAGAPGAETPSGTEAPETGTATDTGMGTQTGTESPSETGTPSGAETTPGTEAAE